MKKVFITRTIPEVGIKMLLEKGYEVTVSKYIDRPMTQKELVKALKKKPYDAVVTLLTDEVGATVYNAAPNAKIFANYAIGYNNIDVVEAKKRGVYVTNTPGGGADRVAEHTWGLILALSCRIVEGDSYMRRGKYNGWDPMLLHGMKIAGKTLGLIGSGRIGAQVGRIAEGFGIKIAYYDVKRNEEIEKPIALGGAGAVYCQSIDEILKIADIVSIHVPLLESTHHLIDGRRLALMKRGAILINTSRGPVVDEAALVTALERGLIAGAGLDVYEFEP
jgi:glyoxylate reductase